ncbi:MAG: hypothetical protein F9B45_24385 [Phycisphaera sp. RhM]|nr:hypothetical protein [Phycisphaera sp. RhM]
MEYLKKLFDDEIDSVAELEVSDGTFELKGEFIRPSEALRELRTDVYEYSFQEWLDQRNAQLIEDADAALKEFDKEDRFDKLVRAYSSGNMNVFVGAGMSYESGFPLWGETLHRLGRDSGITEEQIDKLIREGKYEECAQLIHDDLTPALFNEKLESMFGRRKTPEGAINLLPEMFPNSSLITTNFDTLIEDVYSDDQYQGFDVIKTGTDLPEVLRQIAGGQRMLLKIHGHCDKVADRVLLTCEYEKAYENDGVVGQFFNRVLFGKAMLFLGCSLYADRTIRAMKDFVRDNIADHVPRHYAFVELKDDDDKAERERFLSSANIFPIWFGESQFNLIEAFMTKLRIESER